MRPSGSRPPLGPPHAHTTRQHLDIEPHGPRPSGQAVPSSDVGNEGETTAPTHHTTPPQTPHTPTRDARKSTRAPTLQLRKQTHWDSYVRRPRLETGELRQYCAVGVLLRLGQHPTPERARFTPHTLHEELWGESLKAQTMGRGEKKNGKKRMR